MNIHIDPEKEYRMMQQFFQNGGNVDNMPKELLRVRQIWKEADRLIRRYGYYDNERIANQLIADHPEFNLAPSTAKQHVTAAKRYFDFVETETPATHRRRLTDLLYKQIEKLQIYQPNNPINSSKVINELIKTIAFINHLEKEDEPPKIDETGSMLVISDAAIDFPDMKRYTDAQLYAIIEDVTEIVDLTPAEKKKLIDKDVNGKLI